MLEPFEKLAKAQYPDLNVQEALDRLSQQISKVQELATQDYYRPLAPDLRTIALANLKTAFDHLNTPVPHVRVIALQGNTTRYQFAQEIAQLLAEAGFKASSGSPLIISSGVHHRTHL